jgi:hypothetical protein
VNTDDRRLLEQWLALIDRLREHGWITDVEAAYLRGLALDAVSS